MVGSQSAWVQQFNLLKAVAARRDQFSDSDSANDSLAQLDTFADDIRNMDEAELVRQPNVQQIDAGQGRLEQRFTMSCNVTSAVVVRAQADPVEALRLHQNNEMGQGNLGGEVAAETEQGLENHQGNVAVARQPQQTVNAVNGAIMALVGTAPADELLAVSNYMANQAYNAGKYTAGIAKVRTQIGRGDYPNDQAMRLVRETAAGGPTPGLTPNELSTEMTGTLQVDQVTGQTGGVDWDPQLWALYTADNNGDGVADRIIPSPVPSTWTTRIQAMLNRAKPRLEAGEDITFNVYWNNGGGHTMTFTNVRDVGGTVSYLVHDTWTGTTSWVTEANILQCNWPSGSRGVLCGLIG